MPQAYNVFGPSPSSPLFFPPSSRLLLSGFGSFLLSIVKSVNSALTSLVSWVLNNFFFQRRTRFYQFDWVLFQLCSDGFALKFDQDSLWPGFDQGGGNWSRFVLAFFWLCIEFTHIWSRLWVDFTRDFTQDFTQDFKQMRSDLVSAQFNK